MAQKGELTSLTIVTSILALLGFLILIWFVVRVGIPDNAVMQACHLSVVTRATAPEAATQYLPLKCTTQKICVNDRAGNCKTSFAGEKIREVKLGKQDIASANSEAARTMEATLADEMYSCWSMMGEGKLDLFQSLRQKAGLEAVKSTCVICSRIGLDVAGDNEKAILDSVDVPAYLKSYKIPGGELTYLQAFTDPSVQAYSRVSDETLGRDIAETELLEFKPATPEYAVVFMQVKPVDFNDAVKTIGSAATVAGGAFVLTPLPFKKGLTRTVGRALLMTLPGRVLAAGGAVAGGAYIWSNTDQSKQAAAGYCGEVTTPGGSETAGAAGADTARGCSIVHVVPYDAAAINNVCNYIESAP